MSNWSTEIPQIDIQQYPGCLNLATERDYFIYSPHPVFQKNEVDIYFITGREGGSFKVTSYSGEAKKVLSKEQLLTDKYWKYIQLPPVLRR